MGAKWRVELDKEWGVGGGGSKMDGRVGGRVRVRVKGKIRGRVGV